MYLTFISLRWEEVGLWNSEKGAAVDIRDILWPGEALKPPEGVPERGFLIVTFLEEDPYIMLDQPTACTATKGSICQMVADSELGTAAITAQQKPISNRLEIGYLCNQG